MIIGGIPARGIGRMVVTVTAPLNRGRAWLSIGENQSWYLWRGIDEICPSEMITKAWGGEGKWHIAECICHAVAEASSPSGVRTAENVIFSCGPWPRWR